MMIKRYCSKLIVVSVSMLAGALLALGIQSARGVAMERTLPLKALRTYAEVLELIKAGYVEPVEDKTLIESSIRGMLSNLDPHSDYYDVSAYKALMEDTQGAFCGIGIEIVIDPQSKVVHIIAPIDHMPAQKAGIKSGDHIIKVGDKVTKDITADEVVRSIRGRIGTSVAITVVRQNTPHPLTFIVKRALISEESVRFEQLEPDYGYIRIAKFQEKTHQHLVDAINTLYKENKRPLKGLVIDLRNNPGGLLTSAIGVSAVFLPQNSLIVHTKGRMPGTIERYYAAPVNYLATSHPIDPSQSLPDGIKTIPIVILINSGSASASEIVAGALQDHQRAHIMGIRSFGKGSVQSVVPLASGGGIKLTTAYYFTPHHRSIQAKGITPDTVIEDRSNTFLVEIRESNLKGHLENPETAQTNTESQTSQPDANGALATTPKASNTSPSAQPEQKDYQLAQALLYLKQHNP